MAETTKTQHGGGQSWSAAPIVNAIPKVSTGTDDFEDSHIRTIEVAITAAEILALRATNKELVAAPGTGKVLQFLGAILILDYATAYTESAANLAINYTNAAGTVASEVLEATGLADATTDQIRHMVPAIVSPVVAANAPLTLDNNGAAEWSGGTSVIRMKVTYAVWDTGL